MRMDFRRTVTSFGRMGTRGSSIRAKSGALPLFPHGSNWNWRGEKKLVAACKCGPAFGLRSQLGTRVFPGSLETPIQGGGGGKLGLDSASLVQPACRPQYWFLRTERRDDFGRWEKKGRDGNKKEVELFFSFLEIPGPRPMFILTFYLFSSFFFFHRPCLPLFVLLSFSSAFFFIWKCLVHGLGAQRVSQSRTPGRSSPSLLTAGRPHCCPAKGGARGGI